MLVVLLLACASGWFLAQALTGRVANRTLTASLAVLFGPGLASVVYFGLVVAHAANTGAVYGSLAALLAGSVLLWWKIRESPATSSTEPAPRFPWIWFLAAAFAAGCILLTLDIAAATVANPHGEWDASGIWNLRARYLVGGPETWRRAISPSIGGGMTGSSHPGYPLFLSAFVAMQWSIGGFDTSGPIATGALISAAILALLVAALVSRRSPALGLLAGLLLLGTELFASQASSQYSDLLEGLAFLAALVLLDLSQDANSWRLLLAAGLAIGFAPWIKNEGQPFAIAALLVAFWRFRGAAIWALIGAVPGFAATAALKLMSDGLEAIFPATVGEMIAKIAEPSRWWQALLGFGKAFLDAGSPWTHPVLLVVALAVVLRFIPSPDRRARLWLAIPIAATLAAEYGLYLITTADLDWHISTSVTRLLAQVWPCLLWLFFSVLRAPEEYVAPRESAAPEPITKGRKKRANA